MRGITLLNKGRAWMEEVPQAVFLHLRPILSPDDIRHREEIIQRDGEPETVSLGSSRHGFLFSYQGLRKAPGEKTSRNIYSGVKPASPDHVRITSGEPVGVKQAASYALLFILWQCNHGMLKEGLYLYCQDEVATILQRGMASDFAKGYLTPRFRKILLRLMQRCGPIRIVAVYPDDESAMRKKWYAVGDEVCRNMEHMYWKCWNEVPPIEWQNGRRGMTPEGRITRQRLVTEEGRVIRK